MQIAQTLAWVKQFKNSTLDTQEFIKITKTDSDGNIYVLVTCENYMNPVITTTSTTVKIDASIPNNYGVYGSGILLAKIDKDGNYLWGRFFNNVVEDEFTFDLFQDKIYFSYGTGTINNNNIFQKNSRISVLDLFGNIILYYSPIIGQKSA